MKKIRIISLGEIVPSNLGQGVLVLASIIADKINIDRQLVLPRVQRVLQAPEQMRAIEQFKQGLLTEAVFDALMVKAHCEEFKLEFELAGNALTANNFNTAWDAMNPEYAVFAEALTVALNFNRQPDQQLVFISYTNLKDTRHLVSQLKANNIPCHYNPNNQGLFGIDDVVLYTTYVHRCDKAALIQKAIIPLRAVALSVDASLRGYGLFAASQQPELDIKYIHGVNGIQGMNAMREAFDKTDAAVQAVADGLHVDCILWDKKEVSLANVLQDKNPEHGLVPVARL